MNFADVTASDEVDFTQSFLNLANFQDAVLPNIMARGANLFETSFQGATLEGAQFGPVVDADDDAGTVSFVFTAFNRTNFTGATLTGADLSYAVFSTSQLANFSGANLTGADLRGTRLGSGNLSGVTWGATTQCPDFSLSGMDGLNSCEDNLTACRLFPASAGFNGSCVNGFVDGIVGAQSEDPLFGLAGRDLSGISFAGATLEGSDLSGTNFTSSIFVGASLKDADLDGATLTGAPLTDADLTNVDFTAITISDLKSAGRFNGTTLDGADFSDLDLAGVTFNVVSYDGTVFAGTELQGSLFNGDTEGAIFTDANLRNAGFSGIISDVNFDVADLLGVDFSGTWLNNVDFSQSKSLELGTNDNEVQNVNFDSVLFTGDLSFGDRVIRGGTWIGATVEADLAFVNTLVFVTGTDLTGLCGLDSTGVSFSSTPPAVICPDGDVADAGNTCRLIPSCLTPE